MPVGKSPMLTGTGWKPVSRSPGLWDAGVDARAGRRTINRSKTQPRSLLPSSVRSPVRYRSVIRILVAAPV